MSTLIERGEPFYFPRGPVGCLLAHGFTGSPEEMRWMGEHLAQRGFSAMGVRLFGHATHPADMNRARWQDWLANVEDGYHMLSGQCSRVVAIGFSLGGALVLLAARQLPLAGVVVIDTPIQIPDPRVRRLRWVIPLLSKFIPFMEQASQSVSDEPADRSGHLHYSVYPVRAAAELHDVLTEMRRNLPAVQVPALLMYASRDQASFASDAVAIHDRLGSADKQLLWIEDSGHVIPRGPGRKAAFQAAEHFAERVTG